jgi:chromosome segregation ATPase
MKSLINFKALIIFLFGILIVGCASGPGYNTEYAEIEQHLADTKAESYHIRIEKEVLKEEYSDYKQALDHWEKDIRACNEEEINFIKGLDDNQLEIYSQYEESISNGILAKAELSLRKLNVRLTDKQKNELFKIFDIAKSLEDRKTELNKKQNELTQRTRKLANDINRHERKIDNMMNYLSMRAGVPYSPSPSYSVLSPVLQSLQNWEQSIYRQQQQMQMYSINQSLNNIASAIRGF